MKKSKTPVIILIASAALVTLLFSLKGNDLLKNQDDQLNVKPVEPTTGVNGAEYYNKGFDYYEAQDFVQAEVYFEKALQQNVLISLGPLGESELNQDKFDEAEEHLLRSLRLENQDDIYYSYSFVNLGNLYHKKGQFKKAKVNWSKAADMGNSDAIKSLELFKSDLTGY